MKKAFKKFLFLVIFFSGFLVWGNAFADTHTAASCSYTDVSEAVTAAVTGDTVSVPAGSCNWGTNTLTTTKSLKWLGAGSDQTIITGDGTEYIGLFNLSADSGFEMSGFQWISTAGYSIYSTTLGKINAIEKGWRINHNTFVSQNSSGGFGSLSIMGTGNGYYGLIDNNIFDYIMCAISESNPAIAQVSWQAAAQWGTDDTNFVENNIFYGKLSAIEQLPELINSNNGVRITIRYNTFYDAGIQNHSACESSIRGTRSYEVYNNLFRSAQSSWIFWNEIRAGSEVVTRNKITGTWFSSQPGRVYIDNRRSFFDPVCTSGWGGNCDGASVYDSNISNPAHDNAIDGWRCLDQPGAGTVTGVLGSGHSISSDPIYIWDNISGKNCMGGTNKWQDCTDDADCPESICSTQTLYPNTVYLHNNTNNLAYHIVASREYFVDVAKSDWSAYTCPHPLAGLAGSCDENDFGREGYNTSGGDLVAPASPTGLSVS